MSEQASEGEKGGICVPGRQTGHFPWEALVAVQLIQRGFEGRPA